MYYDANRQNCISFCKAIKRSIYLSILSHSPFTANSQCTLILPTRDGVGNYSGQNI